MTRLLGASVEGAITAVRCYQLTSAACTAESGLQPALRVWAGESRTHLATAGLGAVPTAPAGHARVTGRGQVVPRGDHVTGEQTAGTAGATLAPGGRNGAGARGVALEQGDKPRLAFRDEITLYENR